MEQATTYITLAILLSFVSFGLFRYSRFVYGLMSIIAAGVCVYLYYKSLYGPITQQIIESINNL